MPVHPGPHCSWAQIISEVICAQTDPANNHHLTRFNQQLLAANKIAVVKHSPRSITKQTQTNPFRKPGKGQMPARESPLPSESYLGFLETSSDAHLEVRVDHVFLASTLPPANGPARELLGGQEEVGRHLLPVHLRCHAGWTQNS